MGGTCAWRGWSGMGVMLRGRGCSGTGECSGVEVMPVMGLMLRGRGCLCSVWCLGLGAMLR